MVLLSESELESFIYHLREIVNYLNSSDGVLILQINFFHVEHIIRLYDFV